MENQLHSKHEFMLRSSIIVFLAEYFLTMGCNLRTQNKVITNDTILNFKNSEVIVRYRNQASDSVSILETTTKNIDDSLIELPEYRILKFEKKHDSLNFLEPIDSDQIVNYFFIKGDTLICDLYYYSFEGLYTFGKVLQDSRRNIILMMGDSKQFGKENRIDVTTKIHFKIYIPPKFKLNKIYLRWENAFSAK